MRQILKVLLLASLAVVFTRVAARGQQESSAPADPSAAATPSATIAPIATPTPIPLAEVITQAESVSGTLRDIEADLASDQITATVDNELPVLTREIDARLAENSKILSPDPSLETLRNLQSSWQTLGSNLSAWRRNLTTRATQLDGEVERLAELGPTWERTLDVAQNSETPPDVLQRMASVIAAIRRTREAVERRRAQVLTLQNRVAEQDARITEARASVRRARDEAVDRLFVKESPSIWSAEVRARAVSDLIEEGRSSIATQLTALNAYAERQREKFFLHVIVIFILIGAFYWVRRRVRPWVEAEPSLARAALVFDVPAAAATVLSILISGRIYPQAPRLWLAILGAVVLLPTVIILRRLVERHLHRILNALVIFYCVDLLRTVTASLQLVSRVLFLAEMLGGIIFLAFLIKSARLAEVPEDARDGLWKIIRTGARVALVIFSAAFIANALGYVSLANLLGNAVLGSTYIAVILYAAVRIVDGLIMFALRVRPLTLLGMVREHRPLFRRRVRRVLQFLAFLLWALYTLELLSLRAPFLEGARAVLTASLTFGSLNLSLGNVLAFVIAVWASFMLSRFIGFLLEEDVYPRFHLARGLPYAISTVLHYAILLIGFFVAVAALGIDMTKFTILAGAFSVGLGFGLQNIVNNFVSGLIVLFERPVQVGDVIQMDDASGTVERIGIRASVIRTVNGSEIIVPNGRLISDPVTNWTFSSRQRGIEIRIGVAYGTDPNRVIELLKNVAAAHPLIVADPPPQALFIDFGPDSLNFELRAWTNRFEDWAQIRSDLAVAINSIFAEENIQMPYAQRDLHLRSVDPAALKALVEHGSASINSGASPTGAPDANG